MGELNKSKFRFGVISDLQERKGGDIYCEGPIKENVEITYEEFAEKWLHGEVAPIWARYLRQLLKGQWRVGAPEPARNRQHREQWRSSRILSCERQSHTSGSISSLAA